MSKAFIKEVTERLNKRVRDKINKDGTFSEEDIYNIFIEESGLKGRTIVQPYTDMLANYAISKVDSIIIDPDFRRAANTIKRRYSNECKEFQA